MRRRRFLRECGGGLGFLAAGCGGTRGTAIIGAKAYSEQVILGEVLAQLLEQRRIGVTRRFYLTTFLLHGALTGDDLDGYVEYTGTAFSGALGQQFVPGTGADEIYARVREGYAERFGLVFGPPLGFVNDYAVALRRDRARELGVRTISDLSRFPELSIASGYEFIERNDGFPGMLRHYRFPAEPRILPMDLNLVYQAVVE